jgi:microcystin-dependent protein
LEQRKLAVNLSITHKFQTSKTQKNQSDINERIYLWRPTTPTHGNQRWRGLGSLPSGGLCDGAEVEIAKYQTLYDIIGTTYNGSTPLIGFNTFRLPDLRGRFALGRDNMDNATTVPLSTGSYVDAGGGAVNRVPGTKAQTLGGDAGQSSATLTLTNLPPHTHSLQKLSTCTHSFTHYKLTQQNRLILLYF